MAKDLNGKELGRGIVQLRSGSYQARIFIKGYSKPIYASSKNLKEVKRKREKRGEGRKKKEGMFAGRTGG